MLQLVRFCISLEKPPVTGSAAIFGREIIQTGRKLSEALFIGPELIKKKWTEGEAVAGAITSIYDQHRRCLLCKITHIQHQFQKSVVSTQHIHSDNDNCLEIVVVKGNT